MAIDWTHLGAIGGDGLEDFAATCLRQRYADARQTRPASGDGGVDVYRDTLEGLVVWQVKRFTAPVTPDQRQQIKRSWQRFWETHVVPGRAIGSYTLVTPWTPTAQNLEWFRDELCADADFCVSWEGAAFFNMLAADYPATFDRFFKGPDMLENMVTSKALLASSPVESGDAASMLDAIDAREDALRDIKDMVSDNYEIDTSIVRMEPGAVPQLDPTPPKPTSHSRWRRIDAQRWKVDSVVAKNAQSSEVEPITFSVRFLADPDSSEEEQLAEWRTWGVPFTDVRAETQVIGGPFADEAPSVGLLSIGATELPDNLPRLRLSSTAQRCTAELEFTVHEVTRGSEGGGLRIVATSPSGVISLESRTSSRIAPSSFALRFTSTAGQIPGRVVRDLDALDAISLAGPFECAIEDGPVLLAGRDLVPPFLAAIVHRVARDLARLQPHTTERFLMPSIGETTEWQADHLHRLATIYDEGPFTETWERMTAIIEDESSPFITNPEILDGSGHIVMVEQPEFVLGDTSYLITWQLAHTCASHRLAPGIDRASLTVGSEFELVPSDDNRLIHAAVAP